MINLSGIIFKARVDDVIVCGDKMSPGNGDPAVLFDGFHCDGFKAGMLLPTLRYLGSE